MRIVRLANFVAPQSGGLRTALAELGAGYLAAGHEPVLVIPGERNSDGQTAQGRVITLLAPRVPLTVHLDAARDPATYERRYWSVDRLHPNERGHRLIACRFHALLAASGYPVGPGPGPEPSSPPPTRLAEAGWMATKGTAWLVRRSRDLVPALVGLAVREWLSSGLDGADQDFSDQRRSGQDHEGGTARGGNPST